MFVQRHVNLCIYVCIHVSRQTKMNVCLTIYLYQRYRRLHTCMYIFMHAWMYEYIRAYTLYTYRYKCLLLDMHE